MAFVPVFVFATDFDGNPQSGAKLNLYQAGTTTPQAGYRDATGGTAHTNPVVCSAGGTEVVWLDDSLTYKLVLTNSAESTTFFTEDNISPSDFPGLVIWPAGQGDQTLLTTSSPVFAGLTLTGDFTGVDGEFTGTLTTVDINASGDLTVGGNIAVSGTVDGVDIAALKADVDAFPDGLQSASSAEVSQILNINSATISPTQWLYLGAMNQGVTTTSDVAFNSAAIAGNITVGGTVDGVDIASTRSDVDALQTEIALFDDELQSVTASEAQQVQNIDTTEISTGQWAIVGDLDQGLATTDDVDFATINGAEIDITGAALGQALGFVTSTTKLEPYTAAGMGDLLKAANETITGTYTFSTAPDFDAAPTYDAGIVADARTNLGVYSTTQTDAYVATQLLTVPNRVASIAAMTALDVTAFSAGHTLLVEEADRGGTFVLTDAAYTGDEGVLLAPDTPSGNLHWRRVYDGPVLTKWFGLTTDGVTDIADDFDVILQTYHSDLYIDAGDYYCTASSLLALTDIGLQIPSNSRIEWDPDAWFIHEAGTDTNHFFAALSGTNITLVNPQIDGQGATTNLIGFGSPTRVSVIGGTLKNVRKARNPLTASTVVGGGQGITMQGFPKYCKIAFVHFENCAVPIDAAGSDTNTSVGNVITTCTFDDCETLVGSADAAYSVFDGDEDDDDYKNASWIITNLNFHNCGRSHGEINFEFTRRNSTSSTEYPFQCPAMANTSYGDSNDDGTVDEAGYNWEITDYSTTDLAGTDWVDGTSYGAGTAVVINDDGKQSALFVGLNANHFIVNGVGGYNDDGYGHIGAIVWGTWASSRFVNIDVNVETDYLFRLGGCPAHMFNLVRHFQKSKFIHFGITNSGSTTYAYRIDGPTGTGVNFGTEGLSFDLAFRETNHTSLTHANNDGAFATNGFAGSTKARFQNLETQEVLEGRLDFIGNGSLEWSSFTDGVRTLHSGSLEIHSHSSNAQIKLVRTGTNTADIDIYAIADRLQIDGGDLGVAGTLGIGATPPNDKAMQVSYNDGVAAGDHAVLKFERSTGNFRGITFGYLANGASDTDGYMAANGSQNLVIGHNNNVGGANPTLFLDGANDRVGIGNRAPNQALDVYGAIVWEPGASVTPTRNGEVTVEFTAFDTLTFKGRSGGVVRSATLTLST